MSEIRKQTINEPDLDDVLDEHKNEIFATLNCIQTGKIQSVNLTEQTAEAEIQVKRRVGEDKIESYPLLVDCPLIVLQGQGTFVEMPIGKDDYCLVLFNDRDIDIWWDSANVKEPKTTRKHDLNDGFILVGVNPKTKVLNLEGNHVKINATGFPLKFDTDQETIFNEGSDFMVRYNELESAFNQLKSDFNDFLSQQFATHIHPATTTATVGASATPGVVTVSPTATPTTPSNADITPSKIDDIRVPGVGE